MEYTGIVELDNANATFERQVEKIADTAKEEIKQQVKYHFYQALVESKNTILGEFKKTSLEIFNKVFLERYGNNYDPEILNNSLTFSVDDDLCPHIKYNEQNFVINRDFLEDERSFNQNVRIDGAYSNFLDYDEMEALEGNEFMSLSEEGSNPYEEAQDIMDSGPVEDQYVFRPKKLIRPPKDVYKEAETEALKQFQIQYEKEIKPKLERKFLITL